jgi:hypothetical protein
MDSLVVAALVASLSMQSPAQQQPTAMLYAKAHFSGPSIAVSGPTTKMNPFVVKSLRLPPGTVWELCSGNTFTGCRRYSESDAAAVLTVRSVRPVASPIPETAGVPAQAAVRGSGASLRGLASEFFVMPEQGGVRVAVDSHEAGAAMRKATEFCRDHGWRISGYERVQSVGAQTFLADVLCANEER